MAMLRLIITSLGLALGGIALKAILPSDEALPLLDKALFHAIDTVNGIKGVIQETGMHRDATDLIEKITHPSFCQDVLTCAVNTGALKVTTTYAIYTKVATIFERTVAEETNGLIGVVAGVAFSFFTTWAVKKVLRAFLLVARAMNLIISAIFWII